MTTAAQKHAQSNRGTLFVEEGELVATEAFPGDQFIMRIRAPKCAAAARPGSFVHIQCDDAVPMRRPLSIMRVVDGCIDVLYKIVGEGLHLLAAKRPGDTISVLGPIGQPFSVSGERPNCLLIGGGVGIPPMVFLAETLHDKRWNPLAIFGSEIPFPFELAKSAIATPWLDDDVSSSMPFLEKRGIPSRLTSLAEYQGCFRGYVTDLAEKWLQQSRYSGTHQGRSVRLWTNADVKSRRGPGREILSAMPGFIGGIHGLRGWWMCRLCCGNFDGRWCGHEAGLR